MKDCLILKAHNDLWLVSHSQAKIKQLMRKKQYESKLAQNLCVFFSRKLKKEDLVGMLYSL